MIHERTKIALKKQGKSFEELVYKFFGKRTGNLSSSIKNNSKVVPTIEKCFKELHLVIIEKSELEKLIMIRDKLRELDLY